MSQYGILLTSALHLPTNLTDQSTGITFTLNPLATPGINCANWGCNDPYTSTGTGSGNYGLFEPDIDPYAAMVAYTNVGYWGDLQAGTPIFWAIHVSEISNVRLKAYFN